MKRIMVGMVVLASVLGATPSAQARTAVWRKAGTVKYGFKLAPIYFNERSIEFQNGSIYTGTFQVRPTDRDVAREVLRVNVGVAADCRAQVAEVEQVYEYLRDGRVIHTTGSDAFQRVDFRSVDPLDWIC